VQAIAKLSAVQEPRTRATALPFAASLLGFCIAAAVLISRNPLQLSIATVFLFAGPHNWIEFRYFLSRMPVRWGRSRLFYAIGLGGVAVLTATYALLYWLGQSWYLNEDVWASWIAAWNSVVVLWICGLVHLRGRQLKRDRSWFFAIGFGLCAAAWVAPALFSLALVYVHPLVALWFLDRQLKRSGAEWRRAYHVCLAAVPVMLLVMWARLAFQPNLAEVDGLSWRITQHAGAGILTSISSHLLVATHVFLEVIHYAVWLILIPLVGLRPGGAVLRALFDTRTIPLANRGDGWPRCVKAALILGLFVVFALWLCFRVDYTTTRDIYFTFAMAHVLAEAPFLIRML
jgi:hypothetical protein